MTADLLLDALHWPCVRYQRQTWIAGGFIGEAFRMLLSLKEATLALYGPFELQI